MIILLRVETTLRFKILFVFHDKHVENYTHASDDQINAFSLNDITYQACEEF